ncbi:hypothetical protein P8452_71618 [Trifolium repens]|nr:hypothetical protein P8452_71618 [Trifolium repens]
MSFPPSILFPEILEQFNLQDQYGKKSDLQNHDNEEINTWDILVDKGVYIFPIALHIPTLIAEKSLRENQKLITLVDEQSDIHYPCQISYYSRHELTATYIETGFHEFLLDAKVNIGDKLCFNISIPPDFIDVSII